MERQKKVVYCVAEFSCLNEGQSWIANGSNWRKTARYKKPQASSTPVTRVVDHGCEWEQGQSDTFECMGVSSRFMFR